MERNSYRIYSLLEALKQNPRATAEEIRQQAANIENLSLQYMQEKHDNLQSFDQLSSFDSKERGRESVDNVKNVLRYMVNNREGILWFDETEQMSHADSAGFDIVLHCGYENRVMYTLGVQVKSSQGNIDCFIKNGVEKLPLPLSKKRKSNPERLLLEHKKLVVVNGQSDFQEIYQKISDARDFVLNILFPDFI